MDIETEIIQAFKGVYVWTPNLNLKIAQIDGAELLKSNRGNKEKNLKSVEIGSYTKENEDRKISLKYGEVYEVIEDKNPKENSPNFTILYQNRIVGALWKKKSSKGNSYLSGKLLFPNYEESYITVLFSEKGNTVLKQIAESQESDPV